MSKTTIRKPYEDHSRHAISFPTATMAKQSFKAECDINTIMSKYQRTGLIDHVQKVQGSYGDFTSVQDYQLSLEQVIAAQEAFMELPATVRRRFNNDAAHLLAFLEDPANQEEAVRLGLAEPPPPPQPKEEAKPPRQEPSEKATSSSEAKPKPANEAPQS